MNPLVRAWHALTFTKRYHLLNLLVRTRNYRTYLEIGVRDPRNNFNRIRVTDKEAVDPAPVLPIAHTMKSDEFFTMMDKDKPSRRYDLIFIDGLHVAAQVERDVDNSLRYLADQGTLVLHDCNPPNEEAQAGEVDDKPVWTGSVWKAWAKLRATRADLSMCVLDMDLGCGVIRRGQQTCFPGPTSFDQLDYAFLEKHRRELLNLISVDRWEFERHLQSGATASAQGE